ncbi:MAG: O-antigen ligase family protein [Ruminococcus flavefaciens]|nr:O-antigen ligase family protein [Bacteroides sp.]MCM1233519.1 O-antigen ligase family protein [Ruminococcus flavefaciens]
MKKIFYDFINSIKLLDKLALVYAVLMISRAVGFIHVTEIVYYVVLAVMALYCLSKFNKVEMILCLMLLYFVVNIFIASPPALFKPWSRLVFFTLLLICTSPLLQSKKLCQLRRQTFNAVMWLVSILSVLTFFCYFLGINFMYIAPEFNMYNTVGTFGGLFNQSMMMGPIAGASTIFLSYHYFESKQKWYLIFALCCVGSVFLSSSRVSFMCTVAGTLVMLYKATGGQGRFIKIIASTILIATITFPLWGSITEKLVQKQTNNLEAGSTFSSRENKWEARIAEFESSPVFGIGFASVDKNLDDTGIGGVVEPGSSWLAVLSMTGIIGFCFFILIFYTAYKYCKRMKSPDDALLLGLLVLFAVHMVAEGYVFAAGSFLCFFLWMVIGVCYDRKYA